MSLSNTVLMVSPDQFGYNPETAESNSFQHKSDLSKTKIKGLAITEFKNMVDKLESERIRVLVMGSPAGVITPDAVFPNNWFSHHEDGKLVIYPMLAENRRLERQPHNLKNLLGDAGINQIELIDLSASESDKKILEGTGSMVLDRKNKVAFAMESPRTDKGLFQEWCSKMGYEGIFIHGFDHDNRPIYHTNVAMSVGEEFAVICFDAIRDEGEKYKVEKKLTELKKDIIPINRSQMDKFCANILQLNSRDGRRKIVMSKSAHDGFTPSQKATLRKYGKLVIVNIETIEAIGGGSARCMMAEISGASAF